MRLTVLIPVYNEQDSVAGLIQRVKSVPPEDKEVIVVDDGSSDRTLVRIQRIAGIKVFAHEMNRGKGAAVRTGLAHATGDVVVIQDADLEYDPKDYGVLLAPFGNPKVDAVYGSRFRGNGRFLFHSRMANYFLTFLTNSLFCGRVTDMETCYKAVRRPLLQDLGLTASRFDIEPEITARLLRQRCRIAEVPIHYNARTAGKKIGPKDGIAACCCLLKLYLK